MKLLFAEDNVDVSKAVVTLLTRNNYTVDPVYNGNDALTYLTGGDYDAAVLDVMMPGMDGYQTCDALRAFCNAPVLFLTAKSAEH